MSKAERRIGDAVLGCLLIEPDLCQKLADFGLTERHFYHIPQQIIFRSINHLWMAGEDVDQITVEHDIQRRGLIAEIGGSEALTALFDVIPSAASFPAYVDKLFLEHEEWTRKLSIQTGLKLIEEGNTKGAEYLLQHAIELSGLRGAGAKTLPVESFGEMEQDLAIPPLVEDFLDTECLAMLFGPSNTGKSFIALDLGFCVATGRAWAGRRVLQGGVVYVAAESPGSIRRRVMALRTVYKGIDHANVPLWMVPIPVDLVTNESGIESLIATVTELQRKNTVRLIIVDTLACTMAGGDENSFQTMGALAGRLGRLRNDCKAAVLGVHHAGKDSDRGARGHSSLRAAVDTEIELKNEEGVRSVTITKARDGENGLKVGFELDPVSIGRDGNGRDVRVPTVRYLPPQDLQRLPTGRALDVLKAGIAALRATETVYITERQWLAAYLADADCWLGMSAASARRTFTRQIGNLIPQWFTRQVDGYQATHQTRFMLSEGVHTIHTRSPLQDNVDTTVSVGRTTPEIHSEGRNSGILDTPGQRPDTLGHASDTAVCPGPDEDFGQLSPPYRKGGSVRMSGLPVQESEEEREARERIESLRPKTE